MLGTLFRLVLAPLPQVCPGGEPCILYTWYIGWVGVGWQRCRKTRRSVRELDNQGTFFFFFFGDRHGWRLS